MKHYEIPYVQEHILNIVKYKLQALIECLL